MALNKEQLVQLGKIVAKADPSAPVSYSFNGESFTYDVANETLRREFNEYAGTYSLYRRNKDLIFSIIEEILDDVLVRGGEYGYAAQLLFSNIMELSRALQHNIVGSGKEMKELIENSSPNIPLDKLTIATLSPFLNFLAYCRC